MANGRTLGRGVINTLINKLPFELHIPGYNFCGPGTRLAQRLARGDRGINELDEACKNHDIAYSNHPDVRTRNIADRTLAAKAWQVAFKRANPLAERAVALGVASAMDVKARLGLGMKKKRRNKKKRKARLRVLPSPKKMSGGFIPFLMPILAATGALAGGAAGIAKAVNDANGAKRQLDEAIRHNKNMEAIALGKGLYLKPYKKGAGARISKKKKR